MTTLTKAALYGGHHPADAPAYPPGLAAQWLRLPTSTVRAWVLGQTYRCEGKPRRFEPVIRTADPEARLLSFRNLVEVHVLAAMRRNHQITLQNIRRAVDYMREQLRMEHPLASQSMLTDGRDILVDFFGEVLNVSRPGQIEMRRILEAYIKRIEHEPEDVPARLYPFTTNDIAELTKLVVIDPRLQFGQPCLAKAGIPTSVIAQRYKSGESIDDIAADYEQERLSIEEALRYELAA